MLVNSHVRIPVGTSLASSVPEPALSFLCLLAGHLLNKLGRAQLVEELVLLSSQLDLELLELGIISVGH